MRTDSIFYKIFETLPDTLFALIGESTDLAKDYEFKSIEVKELAFRIDGATNSPRKSSSPIISKRARSLTLAKASNKYLCPFCSCSLPTLPNTDSVGAISNILRAIC